MNRAVLLALGGVAGAVVLAALLANGQANGVVLTPQAGAHSSSGGEVKPAAFAPSMAGTRPDGALAVAPGGQLVVDAELGYLFDYYLAGLGERDLTAVRAEIERELGRRLAPAAAAQARQLLDRYLRYKEMLASVEQGLKPGPDMVANLRARRDAMLKLRQDYFSAGENAGLFGLADLRDADALARMDIMQDQRLDNDARAARLARLDQALPPALREERSAPVRLIQLEDAVSRMRAAGGGDDAVYRLRASTLSPDAANRLADVDREEAAWKARIAAWRQERAQAGPGAQQQLRDKYFSPQEQKRLAAYE